jgi:NADH dehydrogenase [ubiquinone] 1 alpha subcomplex assembly factor 6
VSRVPLSDHAIYCRDLVRAVRPDQALLAELASPRARPGLWAIAAFDWEVGRIPALVSEPMMGSIRRQWWRDAWSEIAAGTPRRHPVVEALAEAYRTSPFQLADAERYLDGREAEHEGPPAHLPAMRERAQMVGGSLALLEATVVGESNDAALRIGTGWYLLTEICRLPQRLRAGRHGLPEDRLARLDASVERIDPSAIPADFAALMQDISVMAEDEVKGVLVSHPLFRGYARLARVYRKRLHRADWNPFDESVLAPTIGRAWSVLRVRLGS